MIDVKEESTITGTTTLDPAKSKQEAANSDVAGRVGFGKTPAMADMTPQQQTEQKAEPKKKHRTVGNIVYDWGIYGSIAWAGVAVMSLISSHEANHGTNKMFDWWRTVNTKFTEGMHSGLKKTIMKNKTDEAIRGWAKGTSNFLTLGMGGTLLMAPLKWLEDNRQKNAARIDNALGTTPPDPELIEKEVKQTWKSVLSGRAFSWGTSYLAFLAMGPKITSHISNWFGEHATNAWMKMRPKANQAKVREWADLGAFDAVFTVITASLTYVFSRYIAKKDDKKFDLEDAVVADNPSVPMALEPEYYKSLEAKHPGRKPTKPFSERIPHLSLAEHALSAESGEKSLH